MLNIINLLSCVLAPVSYDNAGPILDLHGQDALKEPLAPVSNGLGMPLSGDYSRFGTKSSWRSFPPTSFNNFGNDKILSLANIPSNLEHRIFPVSLDIPEEPNIPLQSLYLDYLFARHETEGKSRGVIVWVPGLTSNNLVEIDIIPFLTQQGFDVMIIGPFGTGLSDWPVNNEGESLSSSEVDDPAVVTGYFCEAYNQLINKVSHELGDVPVGLGGHSKGGTTVKMMAGLTGEHKIKNLKILVPCNSLSSDANENVYPVPLLVDFLSGMVNIYRFGINPPDNVVVVHYLNDLLTYSLSSKDRLEDTLTISARVMYPHMLSERGFAFRQSRVDAVIFDAEVAKQTLNLEINQKRMTELAKNIDVPVVEVFAQNDPLIDEARVISGQAKHVKDYTSIVVGPPTSHQLPHEEPEFIAQIFADGFDEKLHSKLSIEEQADCIKNASWTHVCDGTRNGLYKSLWQFDVRMKNSVNTP